MARKSQKRIPPLVRKSTAFPFQISVACWIDLLGYGAMIAEAEFNPLHSKAKAALIRLRRFHRIVADHSARYFPTLVVNDGAVAYRDLSMRTRSVTHDFLVSAWKLFCEIQKAEAIEGFPGARMVMASGFRMRGRRAGMDLMNTQFQSVMRRFQEKKIGAAQAITEAAAIRQHFDILPTLQANLAFTIVPLRSVLMLGTGRAFPAYYAENTVAHAEISGHNLRRRCGEWEHTSTSWPIGPFLIGTGRNWPSSSQPSGCGRGG